MGSFARTGKYSKLVRTCCIALFQTSSPLRIAWQLMCLSLILVFFLTIAAFVNPWPLVPRLSDLELTKGPNVDEEILETIGKCNGDLADKKPSVEQLTQIFKEHSLWLGDHLLGRRANLCGADLAHRRVENVSLRNAILVDTKFTGATLRNVDLTGAILIGAKFNGAILLETNLTSTRLDNADFSTAIFRDVKLINAFLVRTLMNSAKLFEVDLYLVNFEPSAGSLPNTEDIILPANLETMRYTSSPHGLVELRDLFRKAGKRSEERALTYAIKRSERVRMNPGEKFFNWLLFDLPSAYGLAPGNPLRILGGIVILFSLPYFFALSLPGKAGIWAIAPQDQIDNSIGNKPVRVTENFFFPNAIGKWWDPGRHARLTLGGLYFSILSAFNLGWRDLSVGFWLSRIQSREYGLRATGWVRVVSGIESLVCLYLLALWLLVYFGRPFDEL